MKEFIVLSKMKKIEIYDPAMCCSTGVCGPGVDPELIQVAGQIDLLQKKGFSTKRYNLSNDPAAFVANEQVKIRLEQEGPDVLPIILIDKVIMKERSYPTTEEWSEWTQTSMEGTDCCDDTGGCC